MTSIGFRVRQGVPIPLNASAEIITKAVAIVNEHLQGAIDKGRAYPPPPAGPLKKKSHRYKRTGTLGRKWSLVPAHFDGQVIRGSATNTAIDPYGRSYPSYVYGSSQFEQAPIHAGRWPTRDSLLDRRAMEAELRALFVAGG